MVYHVGLLPAVVGSTIDYLYYHISNSGVTDRLTSDRTRGITLSEKEDPL